jgi:hypothetical protein
MLAQERSSRENTGNYGDLRCTTVISPALQWQGGEGEVRRFSYLLESHMTYLASSHILRSWPGIRLKNKFCQSIFFAVREQVN